MARVKITATGVTDANRTQYAVGEVVELEDSYAAEVIGQGRGVAVEGGNDDAPKPPAGAILSPAAGGTGAGSSVSSPDDAERLSSAGLAEDAETPPGTNGAVNDGRGTSESESN